MDTHKLHRPITFFCVGLGVFATFMCGGAKFQSPKHLEQTNAAGDVMIRAVATPPTPTVLISWSFPTNMVTPDLKFRLRSSTNLTRPLATWPVVTNVPGTNRAARRPVNEKQEFFTLTASNYLGESGYATK